MSLLSRSRKTSLSIAALLFAGSIGAAWGGCAAGNNNDAVSDGNDTSSGIGGDTTAPSATASSAASTEASSSAGTGGASAGVGGAPTHPTTSSVSASASVAASASASASASAGSGGGVVGPDCSGLVPEPSPGLGAWYKLDEPTGLVCDYSGNGNNGTVEGAGFTRAVPGAVGDAMQFNGSDGRVHVPASASLDFKTGGTIELWVKLTSLNGVGSTVSRGTGNSDNNVLMNSSCGNMQTIFSFGVGTTNVTSACSAIALAKWTHIAVVNDGTTLTMYENGAFSTMALGGDLGALASDLYIGRREQGLFALSGVIDDIKWWTVARTLQEICTDAGGSWNGSCQLPQP